MTTVSKLGPPHTVPWIRYSSSPLLPCQYVSNTVARLPYSSYAPHHTVRIPYQLQYPTYRTQLRALILPYLSNVYHHMTGKDVSGALVLFPRCRIPPSPQLGQCVQLTTANGFYYIRKSASRNRCSASKHYYILMKHRSKYQKYIFFRERRSARMTIVRSTYRLRHTNETSIHLQGEKHISFGINSFDDFKDKTHLLKFFLVEISDRYPSASNSAFSYNYKLFEFLRAQNEMCTIFS